MIQGKQDPIDDIFVSYIELAVAKLARGQYTAFLQMFDDSRLSEDDLVLALRFLDTDRPITRVDNPLEVKSSECLFDIGEFNSGDGYYMDYYLTTDGELNDLTLSCEFLKADGGYSVCLSDLRAM